MAKKANITPHTLETYAIVSKVERRLTDLYGSTYQGVLQLSQVRNAIAAGQPFTFEKNRPETKALIKSLDTLSQRVDRLLQDSVTLAWQKGEDSVTNACYSAFGRTAAGRDAVRAIADRAREDLRGRGVSAGAFYTQKHGGLNISDRVWGNSLFAKQEIEEIIQQGILQGKSADEISRSVRGYLNNPSKLFRRVRNKETGELELSKNAKNYHPGRGVYRSSYQNALRLARTEVNAAYRRAEWESYQNNPLITGYRIELSNNHTTTIRGKKVVLRDICDDMAGEYPKTFQWTGWHPQCRCRMVPIFIKESDFRARIRALAAGKLDEWKASNTVTEPPKAFTDWVAENADRLKAGKQMPYFIADNYVGGDPTKGLVKSISSLKQQVQQSKKIEPVTEYDAELAQLETWSATFELDTTQARILREAGDKAGLKQEIERLQELWQDRSADWSAARTRLRIFAEQLKPWPETFAKYGAILDELTMKSKGPTWREALVRLRNASNQAKADYARMNEEKKRKEAEEKAKQAKEAAKKNGVIPPELEKEWFKEGDKRADPEFWKLIDPDKPIALKVMDKTPEGGAYYQDSSKTVYFQKGSRRDASSWYRTRLIYHEFGHGIDYQRGLRWSKEVATIREAQRKRLMEKVTYHTKELEWVTNKETGSGSWEYVTKPVKIARADAICRRIDAVLDRMAGMKPETFKRLFPGMTRADYGEAALAVKDTIKSLIVKYGAGHSTKYFSYSGMKETEWLAHCFENTFAGNSVFKHFMPTEYKEMVDYIKSLSKY